MKALRLSYQAGAASFGIVVAKAALAMLLCCGLGIVTLISFYEPLKIWWATNQCNYTTAKITELYEYQVDSDSATAGESLWSAHIEFEFKAGMEVFNGNNFIMRNVYPSKRAASKELEGYELGENIAICYMPDNPRASWPASYSIPLRTIASQMSFFLIGALLVALGIMVPIRWARDELKLK